MRKTKEIAFELEIESTGFVGDYRKRLVLVIRNREAQPTILAREEAPIDP
ncbi:MAG: hypothetical protein AAGJ83_09750 [Planctomycetota bacterium]